MFQTQSHHDPVSAVTSPRPPHADRLHLLDGIARELTPAVWALGAQCSVLRLPADLTARERRFVDAVEVNVRRIARALAGVHDLALFESGEQPPLDPRPAHVAALCDDAIEQLREVGIADEIGRAGEGDGEGQWDPERLSGAISLLLECALEVGAGEPQVQLRWRGGPEEVVLVIERPAVSGEEPGIDLEFGDQLGAAPEGGLKAAVARRVILGHGGTLARFASSRAVAYVALLPRRPGADLD